MTTLEIIENAIGIEYLGDIEHLDVEAQQEAQIQPHSNKIVNL